MALAPVSFLSDPIEDFAGYWLKFFLQGTTTPVAMATDATGGTTLARAEISSGGTVPIGFIKTAGDVVFIPHLSVAYDAWLFPTAAEADANNTTNATQIADNVSTTGANTLAKYDTVAALVADTTLVVGDTVQTTEYSSGKEGGAIYKVVAAGTGTADGGSFIDLDTHQAQALFSGIAHTAQWGMSRDGATNDGTLITAALTFADSAGLELHFNDGSYATTSTIVFAASDLRVVFEGDANIKPDAALLVGVTVGSTSAPARMSLHHLRVVRASLGTGTENIGIQWFACSQCTFYDPESRDSKYNFKYEPASGGFQHNVTINPQCIRGVTNLWINPASSAFVNENLFVGGRMFAGASTTRNILVSFAAGATSRPNSNLFDKTSCEGTGIDVAIEVDEGHMNTFLYPRTEGATIDVLFTKDAQYNRVESNRIDLRVEDFSINKTNNWRTRFGTMDETGANNIIGALRKYAGSHTTDPASLGLTISAATAADPVVITATAHGLSNGDRFVILEVAGMTELNEVAYTASSVDTNTITLQDSTGVNVDGEDFTAYSSGGYVMPGIPSRMEIDEFSSSGVSHGTDYYNGRNDPDGRILRFIRLSTGEVEAYIGTQGKAEFKNLNLTGLAEFANDAAAASLAADTLYRTSTGEIRIKL